MHRNGCIFPKTVPEIYPAIRGLDAMVRARRAGQVVDRTGEDAGLADQRLRVLPRHAQQGRARHGRNEAAALLLDGWREYACIRTASGRPWNGPSA